MAIYDSTASSSVMHLVLATMVPSRQRIQVATTFDRALSTSGGKAGGGSLSRAVVAWSTTVGVSLLLLKLLARKKRTLSNNGGARNSNASSTTDWVTLFLELFFRKRLERNTVKKKDNNPTTNAELYSEPLVTHQGSCHCASIVYEVDAPRCLQVRDADDLSRSDPQQQQQGRILYASAKVQAGNFRLLRGHEQWQTYHVPNNGSDDGNSTTTTTLAYSFCRNCAVHLLHASDADACFVSINVKCLTTPWTAVLPPEEEEDGENATRKASSSSRGPQHSVVERRVFSSASSVVPHSGTSVISVTGDDPSAFTAPVPRSSNMMEASSFLVTNPLNSGVDWPTAAAAAAGYHAGGEDASTISSTTTSSPLLEGLSATMDCTTATTATTNTSMMSQQHNHPTIMGDNHNHNNSNSNNNEQSSISPANDPMSREKLRQYMGKYRKKGSSSTTLVNATTAEETTTPTPSS